MHSRQNFPCNSLLVLFCKVFIRRQGSMIWWFAFIILFLLHKSISLFIVLIHLTYNILQWEVTGIKKCNISSWYCKRLYPWSTWRSIFVLSLPEQSYSCRSIWSNGWNISGGAVCAGACEILGCVISPIWWICDTFSLRLGLTLSVDEWKNWLDVQNGSTVFPRKVKGGWKEFNRKEERAMNK